MRFAILLLLAAAAQAQFTSISSNLDGTRALLAAKDADAKPGEYWTRKIYSVSARGAELVLERELSFRAACMGCVSLSNFAYLSNPQFGGLDAEWIVFQAATLCGSGGSSCIGKTRSRTELHTPEGAVVLGPGAPFVSSNGRFVLAQIINAFEPGVASALFDLKSGRTICNPCTGRVPAAPANDGSSLALTEIFGFIAPGTRLFAERLEGPQVPGFLETGQILTIPHGPVLSADGFHMAYETLEGVLSRYSSLWFADLRTGVKSELVKRFSADLLTGYWLAPDASFVVVKEGAQLKWFGTHGEPPRVLAPDAGDIVAVAVSGDSRVVVHATASGRVIRHELATGKSDVWIDALP